MSDTTDAPEAPVTPVAPEPSRADKLKTASRDALKLGPKGAKQAVAPAPAPVAVAAKVEAIEATGEAAPEQKAGESDKNYELRLANTLRRLEKAEGEAVTYRKRGDDFEKELGPLRAKIEAAKGDPDKIHDLLDLAGYTPDQVAQFMIDGKIKRRAARAELPPDVIARLEKAEAAAKKLEEKEAAEQEEQGRQSDLRAIGQQIEAMTADLPLASQLPGLADRVYGTVYAKFKATGEVPDLAVTLREVEASLVRDARPLLSTAAGVKALVGNDPKIRAIIAEALGLASAEQASASPASERKGSPKVSEGPKSLSLNVTSEVPTRQAGNLSKSEREARVRTAARGVLGLK